MGGGEDSVRVFDKTPGSPSGLQGDGVKCNCGVFYRCTGEHLAEANTNVNTVMYGKTL